MIELQDDRGKSDQTQIQIETENDLQQLLEQEEAIRKLEVNEFFSFTLCLVPYIRRGQTFEKCFEK